MSRCNVQRPREKALDPNDITLRAADRLEAALERLFLAMEARLAQPSGDMVPRAELEVLSGRLDEALGRLRLLLGEDAADDI